MSSYGNTIVMSQIRIYFKQDESVITAQSVLLVKLETLIISVYNARWCQSYSVETDP